ncbi:MAG: MtrB/PioB family outer membrane beta-barrel protein [Nitrospirae bacterium]|nr:MtrB/PioB family outer membrane beta-barrel protein [Nitrospirota bacterium]
MMKTRPRTRTSDVTGRLCFYRNISRYLYVPVAIVVLTLLLPALLRAEEDPDYSYSSRYSLGIGYNWSSLDGSKRAIEYQSGIKSPALRTGIEIYPLPHRFYLDFLTYEKDDLYVDTGYAYREILLSRLIMRELIHNLDHYRFPDSNPDEVKRKYDDRNIEGVYQTDNRISSFFLRLKTPDYPVHLYSRYFRYDKKGDIQQRFLIGTFNDMTVTSQGRQIDFRTEELVVGSNGHFGPVEIEYSHGEKNFVPRGNTVLSDIYPATSVRPGDVYPHNLIPETRTSSDYIKVHSSYTGRITASASVGSVRQSNRDSSVKRDMILGAGQLSYIPMDELSFFLRFSYRNTDEDAPATTALKGLTNELTYEVRPPLDVRRREVSLNIRARPLRSINLAGIYSVSKKDRSATEEWLLANRDTTVNILTLKVYGTLLKGVKFRTSYKYSDLKNPVYNTEPDLSHELKFYTSYSPFPGILAVLTYNLKKEIRDKLRFIDNATDIPLEAGQRNNTTNNILGLVMLTPGEKTSVTLECGYYRNKLRQTLMYSTFSGDGSSTPGDAIMENGVPYSDESTSYSIGVTHQINDKTDISADMGQTHSKGKFRTSNPLSENIASFSMLKVTETALSIRSSYAIINGFGIETMLGLRDYNDRVDDYNDGKFYQAILILTKRW